MNKQTINVFNTYRCICHTNSVYFAVAMLLLLFINPSLTKADDLSVTYKNPIINSNAADPSVIKANDGWYYLYGTGERIWKSKDMVNWAFVGKVFEKDNRPSFVPGVKSYWAPDINKIGKNYVLYYSLSIWAGEDSCGVGVAVSKVPEGPFKPIGDGKLFSPAPAIISAIISSLDLAIYTPFLLSYIGYYSIKILQLQQNLIHS